MDFHGDSGIKRKTTEKTFLKVFLRFLRLSSAISVMILALCLPTRVGAQQSSDSKTELRDSQLRLDRIRAEKAQLQRELDQLKSRVRDASREAANIARQRAASESALHELDYQAQVINNDVDNTTRELAMTHAKLRQRNDALNQRLRSIYERGALHYVRVLLSAENFGDLLSRYKYLHLLTLNDRMMISDVTRLEKQLNQQETDLEENLARMESLRQEKMDELGQLELLQGKQTRTLSQFRAQEKATTGRLEQLLKDEAALSGLITDLERKRREEENAGTRVAETKTLTTRDIGALDWPVDGQLVFRFGPERKPNGVVLRYNGIGIAAPAGTPVHAVEAGTIEIAGALEGYGPSVVIGHGGGFYTLYLRLRSVAVKVGEKISAHQVIGTVGGESSDEGPHLEFQVRIPSDTGAPTPDPLNWLRARANTR